ncbi:MAG: hypothetical protein QF570_19645 [Myxococcota bacterium]|nr:hypothetical protein [Myxococcota bacterium]
MSHEDWLQVAAEVSIALAGFSGLAAGLRERGGPRTKVNQSRLHTIVETSLSTLYLMSLAGTPAIGFVQTLADADVDVDEEEPA